jgi:hypothetical protein
MKADYTHILVILDRTGSIESIRDDMIGGFNAFLDEQKKQPGTATLTLVQFDSQDSYEIIYDFKLHCDSRDGDYISGCPRRRTRKLLVPTLAFRFCLVAVHCGVVFNASSGAITECAEPARNSFRYW